MSEILTPDDVERLKGERWWPPYMACDLNAIANLLATIDALAEALRAHVRYSDVAHVEYAAKTAAVVNRVAAWLEAEAALRGE